MGRRWWWPRARRGARERPASCGYYSTTWYEDADGYAAAVRQQSTSTPRSLYFRTDWCPHCRALDELLEDHEVRSRLNELIKVRVNPDHGAAEKQLFEGSFGGGGFPRLFLVADGGSATRLSHAGPSERVLAQIR
jgi:thioredoxin-like negative regulator of GroEL